MYVKKTIPLKKTKKHYELEFALHVHYQSRLEHHGSQDSQGHFVTIGFETNCLCVYLCPGQSNTVDRIYRSFLDTAPLMVTSNQTDQQWVLDS